MADYYSILAGAVSRLATNNAQARQELYESVRTILIAQLRRKDPQISTLGTMGERIAFETAILRVEAEPLGNVCALRNEGETPKGANNRIAKH
jgi:hypothetical protein